MDSKPAGQTNPTGQNNPPQKPQLSWSQPVATPAHSAQKTAEKQATPKKSLEMPAPSKSPVFRNASIAILLIAAVGIVAATIISHNKGSGKDSTIAATSAAPATTDGSTQSSVPIATNGNLSVISGQQAGLQVVVSNISVTEPTWVVVYENNAGKPGNVLGAALFVQGRTSGTVDLLRGTLPDQTYFAGEARDNGDHMYSLHSDTAVLDADGNPLLVQFQTQ